MSSRAIERAWTSFPGIDFRQGELLEVVALPEIRAMPFGLILVSEVLYYFQTDEERHAAVAGIAQLGVPSCVCYFSVIVTGASRKRRYLTHAEFVRLLSPHFNIATREISKSRHMGYLAVKRHTGLPSNR